MAEISVIIPVYNVELYLEECLDSILKQTYHDYEIITVNDGSTDKSHFILSQYAKTNKKIKVISTENQGQSVARNIGLQAAIGNYIIFLDSDDKLVENAFEVCMKEIKKNNLDAIFFGSDIIMDGVDLSLINKFNYERPVALLNKCTTGEEFFSVSINTSKYIVSPCMYICSKLAIKDLKFFPNILHEDNLFTSKLLISGRLKRVSCLGEKLYQRRLRPGSIMTQEMTRKNIDGYFIVAKLLIEERTKIRDKNIDLALANFITQLLHNVLLLAIKYYNFRIPLLFRKDVLVLVYKNKNSKHRFFLFLDLCFLIYTII